VDCLRDAFLWRPPWDEFGQLARKAVWALRAIGTPESLAVIREAAGDEREKPREAATRELRLRGAQDAS
jgi:HEAT repeat protein